MRVLSILIFYSFFCFETVQAQLSANFTSNVTSGCAPLVVNFTDASTGSPSGWSWTFPGGSPSSSTIQNPNIVYTSPGVYNVKLTVSNGSSSNTKQVTGYITVSAAPTVSFTYSPASPCIGQELTFAATSTGNVTSYKWNFGDGNIQTTSTSTVTHLYNSNGSFPVSVVATGGTGCSATSPNNTIVINPKPVASFTSSPSIGCSAPLTVNFTNTSTFTSGSSFIWDFGDGAIDSTVNTSHTYTSTGIYNVKLIVIQGSCKDSIIKQNLVIIQNISAEFTSNNDTICVGNTVNFTETSFPLSTSRNWLFGDGGTSTANNPSYVYNTPGIFTVTLQANASGCSDTATKVGYITVLANPAVNFFADARQSCSFPFTVNFTDSTFDANAVSWSWNFGDGATSAIQNPTHTYASPGNYNVKLTIVNAFGCTATITRNNYIIISPPVTNFTATPLSGCVPLNVTYTSSSTSLDPIISYTWDFGNGNTFISGTNSSTSVYNVQGIFTPKLVIQTATGCKDSLTKINYVRAGDKPTAAFTVNDDSVCFGQNVSFTDLTDIANAWIWSFGDNTSGSVKNPNHLYPDTGTYSVTLIALNNGCADTVVNNSIVTILPPKSSFSLTQSCIDPFTVNFQNTSAGSDSVSWNFGNGIIDSSNNFTPTHTYTSRGAFFVYLTATNNNGCSFTTSLPITIAEPIASFTANPVTGCYPVLTSFSNTSQDVLSSSWSFGNGTSSTQLNPSNTYDLPGAYDVRLAITDINGCKDTLIKYTEIKVLGPQPGFNTNLVTGCTPLSVNFTDTTLSDSSIVYWIWTFGDGIADTLYTSGAISHTYNSPGTYTVSLKVLDINGCEKNTTKSDLIKATFPLPSFNVDTIACKNNVLTFNASSSNAINPTYLWNFGDGSPVQTTSTNTITHTFTSDNDYVVSLQVIDVNGCDSTIFKTIHIIKPEANFNTVVTSATCGTSDITFIADSTDFINSWTWDFGEGGTPVSTTSPISIYNYSNPGSYDVTLYVQNLGGCRDTIKIENAVNVFGPVGSFQFTPANGCNPLQVSFEAISSNTSSYIWYFGDGESLTTSTSTVNYTYKSEDTFHPLLFLEDLLPDGSICRLPADTGANGTIIVETIMEVDINPFELTIKEDSSTSVSVIVSNVVGLPDYLWSPQEGLNCATCSSPTITSVGKEITYVLTVTDDNGCVERDTLNVHFEPCTTNLRLSNIFTPNDDGINDILQFAGVCETDQTLLLIYNRWGQKMFEAKKTNQSWDGITNVGSPAEPGVYFYTLTVNDLTLTGFFHLVK